ncbi:F0F1 ATP synthase subunit gamma [Marinobacteraceae bacterium S3BR75-40.1]
MSGNVLQLRRKIANADDLLTVVRTMKTLAAANIGQYEQAVVALADYYRTVEQGLGVCLRQVGAAERLLPPLRTGAGAGVVVFGSDQGLVGQFNADLEDYLLTAQKDETLPFRVWAVGERIQTRLSDAGVTIQSTLAVPQSVAAITPLVQQLLFETESLRALGDMGPLYLFHNRPEKRKQYRPSRQRLLPLDRQWRQALVDQSWEGSCLPEVIGGVEGTLRTLIYEYLFVSLFRACAESMASENASRLAAMQRAENNINERLDELNHDYHRLRQSLIDEELFDVVSGFEALANKEGGE